MSVRFLVNVLQVLSTLKISSGIGATSAEFASHATYYIRQLLEATPDARRVQDNGDSAQYALHGWGWGWGGGVGVGQKLCAEQKQIAWADSPCRAPGTYT